MRKRIILKSIILLVCCIILSLMAVSVSAEPKSVIEYLKNSGAVSIYVSGLKGSTDYALMVLHDSGSYTVDNLVYLDQVTTTSEGSLSLCFIQSGLEGAQLALGGDIIGETSPYKLASFQSMDGKFMETPGTLTIIEEEAFAGNSFQYVYLGSQVQQIGSKAFANCSSLKAVHIPNNVVQIADNAFVGCNNLVIICSPDSNACAFAIRNHIPYILN